MGGWAVSVCDARYAGSAIPAEIQARPSPDAGDILTDAGAPTGAAPKRMLGADVRPTGRVRAAALARVLGWHRRVDFPLLFINRPTRIALRATRFGRANRRTRGHMIGFGNEFGFVQPSGEGHPSNPCVVLKAYVSA